MQIVFSYTQSPTTRDTILPWEACLKDGGPREGRGQKERNRMRSGRCSLQRQQSWTSQPFSLRLYHHDQSGMDWLWQPGWSTPRHRVTEHEPDLCCSLKSGGVGDYQGIGTEELLSHFFITERMLGEEPGDQCRWDESQLVSSSVKWLRYARSPNSVSG